MLREKDAAGTQTVGGFTSLRYVSGRAAREDTITTVSLEREPPWARLVVDRLNELVGLPEDWDPRGSMPISLRDAQDAADFLNAFMTFVSPAPAITPLPSGGLELAWHVDGVELEVVFDSANEERSAILEADGAESELLPEAAARCVDFLGSPAPATA